MPSSLRQSDWISPFAERFFLGDEWWLVDDVEKAQNFSEIH